jgi:hypothetical protein
VSGDPQSSDYLRVSLPVPRKLGITLRLLLLAVLAASIISCGSGSQSQGSSSPPPPPTPVTLNSVQLVVLHTNVGLCGQPQTIKATKGNLIVVSYIGGPDDLLDSVTDNQGNTYVSVGTAGTSQDGGECWIYYAANAKSGVTQMTFQCSENSQYDDANIYDISGAAGSPLDNATNISNQDETSFGPISGPAITANTAGGIVIANVGIESNEITGVNSPFTFDPQDEENGWGHVLNTTSGTTYTPTWTTNTIQQPGGVNFWGGVAAAFKAAPSQ